MKKFILSIILSLTLCTTAPAEFFSDIIVTSPNGIWTDSRAYSSLNSAITAVGANDRTILIASPQTVTSLTVPSNITLQFERDGAINNSGQLTIQTTNINAPARQIFTGTGDIDFAVGTVVKTSWFDDFVESITQTNDDYITLLISERAYVDANATVGDNVILRSDSYGNRIVVNLGFTLSNISQIMAGDYQVFAGSGDFDFLDGSLLNLRWFNRLRSALTWIESEEVTILVPGTNAVDFTDTAPANVIFDMSSRNGMFSISAGQILTVYSPDNVIAKAVRIKQDDGTLLFTAGGTVYPQWFGAVVDDGIDDQPYIQEAIDSIPSGLLRLITGTYRLNTMQAYTSANTGAENGLLVIEAPISVKGDGRDNTILDVTLDSTFTGSLVINGANGVTVEDIAITGTGTAYNTNYGSGIRVLLSARTTIKNNYFKDLRGIGINFVGNFGGAAGNTGVDHYCTYGVVEGNTLIDINGDGIYHVFSKYNHTSNNFLVNVGLTDSIIYEASDHSTIANNTILSPKLRSILLNTGSSWSTVTGNTMLHNTGVAPAIASDAILLSSVKYCTVTGNIVKYETGVAQPLRGIVTDGGAYAAGDPTFDTATYHTITGNIIQQGGHSTEYFAMHIGTGLNLVSGNSIVEGTYGIAVEFAKNSIIGNKIEVAGNCIRLDAVPAWGGDLASDTYIANNWLEGTLYPIFIGDAVDGTIMVNNHSNIANHISNTATNTTALGNTPNNETLVLVADSASLSKDTTFLDSTAGAMLVGVFPGGFPGQTHTFLFTVDGGDAVVSVTDHRTSNPEWFYFREVGDTLTILWDGTYWNTILNIGVELS